MTSRTTSRTSADISTTTTTTTMTNGGDTHHLPGHGPVSFRLPHLGDLFCAVTADPVTGDTLRPSERFSRAVQAVIRRWSFIGAVTLITLAWWTWPALFHDRDLAGWNRVASYLAILIESVVGIGVFSQTLRDAVVIRAILRMEREHGELLRRLVDVQLTIKEKKAPEDTTAL